MSLLGFLFGGDKKTTTTTNQTQVTSTDASANASEGSLAVSGSGQLSIQTLDADVAKSAIEESAGVASKGLDLSSTLGNRAFDFGEEVVKQTLESQSELNKGVTGAAQDSIGYARSLAEQAYSATLDARASDTQKILEVGGKYLAMVVGLVSLAYFVTHWKGKK